MSALRRILERSERALDWIADGLESVVLSESPRVLGVAIETFLGWVLNLAANAKPIEYMNPLEAEAFMYDPGQFISHESVLTDSAAPRAFLPQKRVRRKPITEQGNT